MSEQESKEHKKPKIEEDNEVLVRVLGYDLRGSQKLYPALTKIKGVSWAISNAVCLISEMPKSKRISELSKEDIAKLEGIMKSLKISDFLMNRRIDPETGETKHLLSTDLDIKKEFDIKRMKSMKSYKGIRHANKLPVRGQRTKSHFRKNKKAMGVKKK